MDRSDAVARARRVVSGSMDRTAILERVEALFRTCHETCFSMKQVTIVPVEGETTTAKWTRPDFPFDWYNPQGKRAWLEYGTWQTPRELVAYDHPRDMLGVVREALRTAVTVNIEIERHYCTCQDRHEPTHSRESWSVADDVHAIADRTAGFLWDSAREFSELTWHPTRFARWCLDSEEQSLFLTCSHHPCK